MGNRRSRIGRRKFWGVRMLTKQQIEDRRKGIGGSDVAAILGLNDYADAIDIYQSKVGAVGSIEENEKMRWGNILEEPIAQEYAHRYGNRVVDLKQMIAHPIEKNFLANIDRIYTTPDGKRGILEIKTTSANYMSGWKYDMPLYWYCQVQWYMWIAKACSLIELNLAHVCVLASGQSMTIIPCEYDKKFIEKSLPALRSFWEDNVLKGIPPEPRTGKQVEKVYTAMAGKEIEATDEVRDLATELAAIEGSMKSLKTQSASIKDKIQVIMKENEILTYKGDLLATWKYQESVRLNQKAMEQDYPDLIQEYKTASGYRKFVNKVKAVEND